MDVTVQKVWDDDENRDGKRPESITVVIKADGTEIQSVTLTAAEGWHKTIYELPKDHGGTEIAYTWEEAEIELPEGYVLKSNESSGYVTTITNAYTPETVDLIILKVWKDDNNVDHIRPDHVDVRLLADGEEVKTIRLSEAAGWTASVDTQPVYKDGKAIRYTWEEYDLPEGYTLSAKKTDGNVTTITNTHTHETTSAKVQKVWDDADNAAGFRPESVTMKLLADNRETGTTVTLSEANGWTDSAQNLPVYGEDGDKLSYSWLEDTEAMPEGYTIRSIDVSVDDGGVNTTKITNTYAPEFVTLTAIKVWNDADNQDALRPETLTVTLFKDGVKVQDYALSETNHWTMTTGLLPRRENGKTIDYTLTEAMPDGYTEDIKALGNTWVFTNTHSPEKTKVSVQKTWADGDNQDGLRPESVTVLLLADGEAAAWAELSDENHWSYTFEDLAKYHSGRIIEYTLSELEVSGYTTELSGSAATGFTLTNTHKPETIDIPVEKIWDDAGNQDGLRPGSVHIALLANGAEIASHDLTEADGWTWSFRDLAKYRDGEAIIYTITEDAVAGYTPTIDGFVITNTHVPETTSAAVTKVWVDEDDQDGIRPDTLTVTLHDGVSETDYILSEGNGWQLELQALPKYRDGEEITYTWTEEESIAGYTASAPVTVGTTTVFTNTHIPEKTEAEVVKTWSDNDNRDGKRPATVTVVLMKNNVATETKLTLAESNGWSGKVTELSKYENHGDEIVYSFMEEAVDGYTISKFEITGNVTKIENRYAPDRFCLAVLKVWDDQNDQDKLRPEKVTVQLMAGGIPARYIDGTAVEALELSAETHWTGMIMGLPIKQDGKAIDYSWEEVDGPALYTSSSAVSSTNARITILTNTYTPEVTEVSVEKVWDDASNQDGKRTSSVTVELLADGVPVKETTLKESNGWSFIFDSLPAKKNGNEITYAVREINVPDGYTASLSGNAKDGFVITNTHVPETVDVTVRKVWDDGNDQDGKRPTELNVTLNTGDTVTLNAGNNWTAKVTGLPKYQSGTEITYTWTEEELPEGYVLSGTETTGYVTTLTNTYTPATCVTEVQKIWEDEENKYGKRPDAIVVILKADGRAIGSETLSEANGWKASRTDLPLKKHGEEITYTGEEAAVPSGYAKNVKVEGNRTILTNTYLTGTLMIHKTFSGVEAGKDVSDLTFSITGPDGFSKTVTYAEFTNGEYMMEGIPEGVYTVIETNAVDLLSGYTLLASSITAATANVTGEARGDIELTNYYECLLGSLRVTKKAIGAPDGAAFRMAVTDGTNYYATNGSVVTEDNKWVTLVDGASAVFNNLPAGTYRVEEADAAIEGLTWTVIGTDEDMIVMSGATTNVTIVNNYTDDLGDLKLVKTFTGVDAADEEEEGKLAFQITGPNEFIQTVYYAQFENGEYTLRNLPIGHYTVRETNADTILASYALLSTSKTTESADIVKGEMSEVRLKNDYQSLRGTLIIQKTFSGTPEGADLSGLTFVIEGPNGYVNVVRYGDFNQADSHRLENLVEGEYTVREINADSLVRDYILSGTSVTSGKVTVVTGDEVTLELTNQYEIERGGLVIQKTFAGLPEDVDVSDLTFIIEGPDGYSEQVSYGEFNNGTSHKLSNIPEGEYTVTEMNAEGLAENYRLNASSTTSDTATVSRDVTATVHLVNLYDSDTTEATIQKIWVHNGNTDVPAELKVTLTGSDGSMKVFTLNEANGWTVTETKLAAKDEDGNVITYSWTEDEMPEGYVQTGETVNGTVTTLVNEYRPEETEATIQKIWVHNGNTDVPAELKVTLTGSDGSTKVFMLNEENGWTVTETKLAAKDEDENAITYSWNEDEMPEGYVLTGTSVNGTVTTLVNTYIPDTSITVRKVWSDSEAEHDPITVKLMKNGTEEAGIYELSADNDWTVTVEGLTLTEDGAAVSYSWSEVSVAGYRTSYSVEGNVTTITNTKIPSASGAFSATKTWTAGSGDATLTLIGQTRGEDGTLENVYSDSITVTGNGMAKWENISLFTEEGEPIFYTLKEEGVGADGMLGDYISTIAGDENSGYTVVNHAQPTPQIIQVTPEPTESVATATPQIIYVTPEPTAPVATATPEIIYVTPEPTEPVATATPEIIYVTPEPTEPVATATPEIIYVTPEPTEPVATPTPEIIYVTPEPTEPAATATPIIINRTTTVYVTPEPTEVAATPTAEIIYVTPEPTQTPEVTETPEPAATPEIPKTSSTVTKIWDDDNNAYGRRPANIRVTLSNGQSYILNAGNGWSVTVSDLPAEINGQPITYTWSEQSVPGYTLTDQSTYGNVTIFTNRYRPVVVPNPPDKPKGSDETTIIDDYETPLGINVSINHVGDCFD